MYPKVSQNRCYRLYLQMDQHLTQTMEKITRNVIVNHMELNNLFRENNSDLLAKGQCNEIELGNLLREFGSLIISMFRCSSGAAGIRVRVISIRSKNREDNLFRFAGINGR
ncbi:hypothetical protein GQR58_020533 [Nymphon striatum]|nr:hypothetical protein GQR58_020533 [Nymphon striatum]